MTYILKNGANFEVYNSCDSGGDNDSDNGSDSDEKRVIKII
jgi:hypothetical protein